MFSVSRPIEWVVLNCWVTLTNETLRLSKVFHDAGEIQQRPAEPVDLVDHDAVHFPGFDVGDEPPQGRPIHVAAGKASVVVPVGKADPALVFLAGDERFPGLPLCVEGIEFQVEAVFARFPCVDGTPDFRFVVCLAAHRFPPRLKKRNPFMWEPVIAFATADSDLNRRPSYSSPSRRMRTSIVFPL
jgi:hypothetical protein